MVTPTTSQAARLSPEEVGYLTAGPVRAAEVALARLLDAGLVRVSRDGQVSAVSRTHDGTLTPVETRILAHLRKAVRFSQVVQNAASSTEMRATHQELRRRKLTRNPRPRLRLWWIFLVIGACLGVAAITAPWLLLGTAGFLGIAWWTYGARSVTRAGGAALQQVTESDRVLVVALHGFRGRVDRRNVGDLFGLPQSVVKMVPRKKKRKSAALGGGSGCSGGCGNSSCGSSGCSSSSSGGSCGGGGCGGGGGD